MPCHCTFSKYSLYQTPFYSLVILVSPLPIELIDSEILVYTELQAAILTLH